MGKTQDFGRRIEIHSLDKFCDGISIGLYRNVVAGRSRFLVHSYHASDAAAKRVELIRQALVVLGGLVDVADDPPWLQFSCGQQHLRATKRAFLDICRQPLAAPLEPLALSVFDKKCAGQLRADSLGQGAYRMLSDVDSQPGTDRAAALARGFAKLCEMEVGDDPATVRFPCRESHDALIGLLMYRAQNVRATLKDEDSAAGRGVLAPPSRQ